MGAIFRDSRAKLANALKYIEEVDAGLRAYDSSGHTSVTLDWKGGMTLTRNEIPFTVNSTLGDAIHNMRAALDLMAAELARINGKSDSKVYFPFSNSKDELQGQIDEKNFDRAGEDAIALLKTFEPYKGGNERLRAIHDLDVRDKHKSIITTLVVAKDINFSYDRTNALYQVIPASGTNYHGFLDGPLAGKPLIKTSNELVELVDGIIETFTSMVELRKARSPVSGNNGDAPA